MKNIFIGISFILLAAGCAHLPPPGNGTNTHSKFFRDHSTLQYFQSFADSQGLRVMMRNEVQADSIAEYGIEFTPEDVKITDVMREYFNVVKALMDEENFRLDVIDISGDVSAFTLSYHRGPLAGVMRVRSIQRQAGSVEIDAFLYERPR